MILRQPLRSVIQPNDSLLVCSDVRYNGQDVDTLEKTTRLYNAVICVRPHDNRIWQTLEYVIHLIEQRHSTGSDLSLTGPLAFYNAIKNNISEENLRFKHGFRRKSINQLKRKYEDYYVKEKVRDSIFITKFYKGFTTDPKSKYGTLWKAKMVYYSVLAHSYPWKVYTYPGQQRCVTASFTEDGAMLLTSLVSASQGYEQFFHNPQGIGVCKYIKLTIINDETSEQYRLEIPSDDLSSLHKMALPFPLNTAT
jgi:hypothetical protein